MAYEIRLTETAEAVLMSLDPHFCSALLAHLDRLAQSPSALSRPKPMFPFASPYGMLTEFDGLSESGIYEHFVVFFAYSQDETTIIIGDIGHWPLDPNAPIREL